MSVQNIVQRFTRKAALLLQRDINNIAIINKKIHKNDVCVTINILRQLTSKKLYIIYIYTIQEKS